jgi:hypothetical protein
VPEEYLPDDADAHLLYAVTVARGCPGSDRYCMPFTEDQFSRTDVIWWMERAYLQPSTGVGPNMEEYVMSFVMTFQLSPA